VASGVVLMASVAIAMSAPTALAQARADSTSADSARRLDPVVTTASRAPVRSSMLARRLDVLGDRELQQSSYTDAADLLKREAGADVIQFGGLLSGIGLRGFRPDYSGTSQRTLLLVDGRPSGVINAALLDVGEADRVEVLRGPASALYGSSAMAGVVNVISRRRTGAVEGTVQASYGSFGTSELRASGGGALWRHDDGRQFDADASVRRAAQSDDYRIGSGDFFRGMLGSGQAVQVSGSEEIGRVPEIGDGVRRRNTTFSYEAASVRAGWAFGNGLRADARAGVFNADDIESPGDLHFADSPFPGNGRKNQRHWNGELGIGGTYAGHSPMVRLYYAEDAAEYYDSPDDGRFVNYVTDVFTRGAQAQNSTALGSGTIVFGADFNRVDADSRRRTDPSTAAAPYSPNAAMTSLAAFGEWRWSALNGRLSGAVGARGDRVTLQLKETALRPDVTPGTERFNVFTPSASVLARLSSMVSIRSSVGRAFVAPDAFAKAGLTTTREPDGSVAFAAGNPDISAERSITIDGGIVLSSASRMFELDLGYFHTHVTDRITPAVASFDQASAPTTPNGDWVSRVETRMNAASARLEGLETRLSWDPALASGRSWSLNLFAGGTWMLTAEERVPLVTADVSGLTNAANFTPEQAFGTFSFGEKTAIRVKNVAKRTITGGVAFDDLDRFRARLSARYVGERRDLDFTTFTNDVLYPAFLVADLSAGARITSTVRADLFVSNVTDENYYEIRGYNLPGRSFALRLTADF
jgi:vitamin B12 transporter